MHVTPIPWVTKVKGSRYGTDHTYLLAAEWLRDCEEVHDWGGGRGHFQKFLGEHQTYTLVDGTQQDLEEGTRFSMADLSRYHEQSDGILLRHVLEMTEDWKQILVNAVAAFQKRMVVVTFTPNIRKTRRATHHLTWPVFHFNHDTDLIPLMQPYLVDYSEATFSKGLPERVYRLEKK
jgi:hypothetical protein